MHWFDKYRFICLLLVIYLPFKSTGQDVLHITASPGFLDSLLLAGQPSLHSIVANQDKYRVQLIYTQIDRDSLNQPHFKTFLFRHRPGEYFYPASTVKLPVAAMSLVKMQSQKNKNIGLFTGYTEGKKEKAPKQLNAAVNPLLKSSLPSIGSQVTQAVVVSDNAAYNSLYNFTGPRYIYKTLHKKAYKNSRIIHQFSSNASRNRQTTAIRFISDEGFEVRKQKPTHFRKKLKQPVEDMTLGNAYYKSGVLNHQAMDFSKKNFIPLLDLHSMLASIVFPASFDKNFRFDLDETSRNFLLKQLAFNPSETAIEKFRDTAAYFDGMTNFFIYGSDKNIKPDSHIRIFNIVGMAYGFLTETAYIVDFSNNTEFLVSATIYVNEDGILNDDAYEYSSVGLPFFKNIGWLLLNYEKNRKVRYPANLDHLHELFNLKTGLK